MMDNVDIRYVIFKCVLPIFEGGWCMWSGLIVDCSNIHSRTWGTQAMKHTSLFNQLMHSQCHIMIIRVRGEAENGRTNRLGSTESRCCGILSN